MLDVHPPEHRISGARDFLIHLLTISAGLLIALGLEAGVEAMHHRSERREATAQLREELTQNRAALRKIQKQSDRELVGLARELEFYQGLRVGVRGDSRVLNLVMNSDVLQSAAWHTASATGVLSLMPYEQVKRYSRAYGEQVVFEEAEGHAFRSYRLLGTYLTGTDPRELKGQDVESAIADVRQVMADVGNMSDITRAVLELYDEALAE